uniref:Uncharacterized protein n=1 Tax=Vespula pensylvanica TaxID=30213 RepID=A0A834NZH8_VESPE|nr:hypothetical protein H0235_009856 [Vespula pensylvanica]
MWTIIVDFRYHSWNVSAEKAPCRTKYSETLTSITVSNLLRVLTFYSLFFTANDMKSFGLTRKNYLLAQVLGGLGRRMSSGDKVQTGLTIDRAAFLLLRVKKAFKKKKQQRKEKR